MSSFRTSSVVGNIGIPLDTVSCFVIEPLKDHNPLAIRVLPVGEVGELAIGGYQLARGYINRPEQTAAAFIDSQYGPLYLTGDKARLHHDGLLECLGRLSDGQVKLRGQRIELGEVEQAALKEPICHSAVASVINGILVLFCATDDDGANADTVTEACKKWLPSFMVPGDIQMMREFPRLPSGKVDRKLLKTRYIQKKTTGLRKRGIKTFQRRNASSLVRRDAAGAWKQGSLKFFTPGYTRTRLTGSDKVSICSARERISSWSC